MSFSISKVFKKNIAEELNALMETIASKSDQYYSVIIYGSRLQNKYKNEFRQKIITNVINEIFKYNSNYLFMFDDHDIILIFQAGRIEADSHKLIRIVNQQVKRLFLDDPAIHDEEENEKPRFCEHFLLSNADAITQFNNTQQSIIKHNDDFCKEMIAKKSSENITDFTPKHLLFLEQSLTQETILKLITTQPIVQIKGSEFTKIFYELFVTMNGISKLITDENINVTSNHGLFRYITDKLDINVLKILAEKQYESFHGNGTSININCHSILSQEFDAFTETITQKARKTILLELQAADIFLDINIFIQARNKATNLGYITCIDGLSTESINYLARENLECDFVKLRWDADLASSLTEENAGLLLASVTKYNPKRIILCRCDSEHAIEYGEKLGIMLYQGWHVDALLSGKSSRYSTTEEEIENNETNDSNIDKTN